MSSATPVDDERTASALFHNQQYEEALTIWKKLVNQKSNAGLYFNIGLAESKLSHSAEAIYAYEQALRICPLAENYAKALRAERKKMDNPVIPLNDFFLAKWYRGWITLLRPGLWALVGLLTLLMALVGYLRAVDAVKGKIEINRSALRWITCLGLLFLLTALLCFRHLDKRDEGIIMKTCALKQASSAESPTLRSLGAGEKIKVKDQIGEWYYVALLNLDYGWIKADSFKVITLATGK